MPQFQATPNTIPSNARRTPFDGSAGSSNSLGIPSRQTTLGPPRSYRRSHTSTSAELIVGHSKRESERERATGRATFNLQTFRLKLFFRTPANRTMANYYRRWAARFKVVILNQAHRANERAKCTKVSYETKCIDVCTQRKVCYFDIIDCAEAFNGVSHIECDSQ